MFIVLWGRWLTQGWGTREENMGFGDMVGCRLNMKINPGTEQTVPIIVHAVSHTMDNHRHLWFTSYLFSSTFQYQQ